MSTGRNIEVNETRCRKSYHWVLLRSIDLETFHPNLTFGLSDESDSQSTREFPRSLLECVDCFDLNCCRYALSRQTCVLSVQSGHCGYRESCEPSWTRRGVRHVFERQSPRISPYVFLRSRNSASCPIFTRYRPESVALGFDLHIYSDYYL
ncbi:hypothetical protein BDZ89DRAFT_42328 [Hymenopellis radicata]|nr:hypothetical protein BDZ89DRAFT_42328 [Hymenopellis radicata]